jgi:hypothetical protein
MKKVKIVLRNPLNKKQEIDYNIEVCDHDMAVRWHDALNDLLRNNNYLEKNFCFLGFPNTARDLSFLCRELKWAKSCINEFFDDYQIEEDYTPETLRHGWNPNQDLMNVLHNHFEVLQGTVWGLSEYYKKADYETKFAIRQLNNICHEVESLMLSQRKQAEAPEWVRPSQITTFLNATRLEYPQEYKRIFDKSRYDRTFGTVYQHWTQIGKTLYEVYIDEGGQDIDRAACEAITHLRYYSGEFDIEWARDVTYGGEYPWHTDRMTGFCDWLVRNGFDLDDAEYNYGYHPVGQVDIRGSFGTDHYQEVWNTLGQHLDIYKIETEDAVAVYDYCWTDPDYYQQQIERLRPGYDYSSRR